MSNVWCLITQRPPASFEELDMWYNEHLIDKRILLQSALQPLVGFRPAQLSLSTLSRKVLQSAVASGTSNPQLGGEPGI
jgi:hypothetical protein